MIIRSLRWRLVLAMLLIVAAMLIAAGVLSSLTVKREFDRYLVKQRRGEMEQVMAIIAAGGRAHLEESLIRVHAQFGRRVLVFDDAGKVIARWPHELDQFAIRRSSDGRIELTRKEGGRIESLRVIGSSERIAGIGTVQLLPPRPDPNRRTFRVSIDRWLLVSLGIAAILAVAVMLTIFRRVFAPVEELTTGARALANGRLDARVRVRGNDEIAELGGAFNSMAESLERNERARRNMVSDVAHELRTPLTNIRVQIEAAQDGVAAMDLRSVEEEVLTLSLLVDDLQQLSLADAGTLRLDIADVAVAALVERATSGLSTSIICDVDPELVIRADARRMVQVLRNLLVNALAHAKSAVDVRAMRVADGVEIRVADDGPGVAAEHVDRIFDRFYRIDASRSRSTGGAGLGLAIAKRLVELHGGTLRYERPAFVVFIRSSSSLRTFASGGTS